MGEPEQGNFSILKDIRKYSHDHPVVKFIVIFLFFFVYLVSASFSFGLQSGILIALITWSFFVFCTPIADAGLLLDFPLRYLTGIRMLYLEVLVWAVALLINLFAFFTKPSVYEATILTRLFAHIIFQPFPYWSIIGLSAMGTFLSIKFGDEILDVISMDSEKRRIYMKGNAKHKAIILVSIIITVIVIYSFLLEQLGVDIPLI